MEESFVFHKIILVAISGLAGGKVMRKSPLRTCCLAQITFFLCTQVSEGTECGLGCDDFQDWAEGDKIECYLMVNKTRKLEDAKASTAVDVATLA
jgi:hypothetical protein